MARARAVETFQGSPLHVLMHIHVHATLPKDFLCLEMTGLFDNSLQLDSSESVIENVQRVPSNQVRVVISALCTIYTMKGSRWEVGQSLTRDAATLQLRQPASNSDMWIQIQKNFIIHNKCIKWKFALWVTRIPPRQTDSLTIQHNNVRVHK